MTCFLYGAVRNGFEAGKIYYEGHWKEWALEIKTFLGPEMATSEASDIWAQKSCEDNSLELALNNNKTFLYTLSVAF